MSKVKEININTTKWSVITLTRLKEPFVFNYIMNDEILKRNADIKDLGVFVNIYVYFYSCN